MEQHPLYSTHATQLKINGQQKHSISIIYNKSEMNEK